MRTVGRDSGIGLGSDLRCGSATTAAWRAQGAVFEEGNRSNSREVAGIDARA